MSAKAAAAETVARKDFVTAFADAVQRFTTPATNEEVLALIPNMLVEDFGAERSVENHLP